jgi:hypothetical protein
MQLAAGRFQPSATGPGLPYLLAVPVENSDKLVAALRACGGAVRFTRYPNADHDALIGSCCSTGIDQSRTCLGWIGQSSQSEYAPV